MKAATAAAAAVGDRPSLWIPGALAWTASIGWIALVAGVASPPSAAELTFFGAGVATSGLWPWNLLVGLAVLALLVLAAFLLASLAECALLLGRRASRSSVAKVFVVAIVCAAPAAAMLIVVGALLPLVAQGEFNAPSADADPTLRTLVRLSPLLAAVLVAAAAGATVHAAAIRGVTSGETPGLALRAAPARLARVASRGAAHAVAIVVLRVAHLLLAAILLRVLWDPIGARLSGGTIDLATILLLVGFVAIWLCLVLSGGALYAWGSATWTRVLAAEEGGAAPQQLERRPGP